MASLALTKRNRCLQIRGAVAPVTSSVCSTITLKVLRTPQENRRDMMTIHQPPAFNERKILDDTRNSGQCTLSKRNRFSEALIQQNKKFSLWLTLIKTTASGGKTRQHLYQKITDFIFRQFVVS